MAASTRTQTPSRIATAVEPATERPACPDCGGRPRPAGHETVCSDCGLVVAVDALDRGPEYRHYGDSKGGDPRRAGRVYPERQGKGLGSEIGTPTERRRCGFREWHAELHSRATARGRERGHRYVVGEVERMAAGLNAGASVAEQAKRLYRTLIDGRTVEGYDLDTLAAAAVYAALRVNQRGVTPSAVAAVARTDADRLRRRYTWLVDELGVPVPPPSVEARVRQVASGVGVDEAAIQRALERVEQADECAVSGGSPSTLAAGVLWQVSEATQAEAADAAGVTPGGLRKRLEQVGLKGEG